MKAGSKAAGLTRRPSGGGGLTSTLLTRIPPGLGKEAEAEASDYVAMMEGKGSRIAST
mgnify:CR=1 FL=1